MDRAPGHGAIPLERPHYLIRDWDRVYTASSPAECAPWVPSPQARLGRSVSLKRPIGSTWAASYLRPVYCRA